MTIQRMIWRELWERPFAMLTAVMAILLSVAALVAIRHVTVYSERVVGRQLADLGANVLILPKDATLRDYFSADLAGATLPESYVSEVLFANLPGVEKLSPRLCLSTDVAGNTAVLTGILPQSEFKSAAKWRSVRLFQNKHQGCQRACVWEDDNGAPQSLATVRSIAELPENAAILGADVAESTGLQVGQSVVIEDFQFRVLATLPHTGTVDDTRVFAHLHTVQRITDAGEVVNAIEVVSCCDDAASSLVPELRKLLPDSKVVTISQVVATQVGVNQLMRQLSWLVFGILVVMGGTSVASTISANVRDRRREIGTLAALGATPRFVQGLFLLKACLLGAVGSVGGCIVGCITAMLLGVVWMDTTIRPLPGLLLLVMVAGLLVTATAAWLPARRASRLDPCVCFQEV